MHYDESITPVTSSLVEYQQIAQKVYASGKLTHKGKQALAFKVSGTLDSVNVEEGQYVKRGMYWPHWIWRKSTLNSPRHAASIPKAREICRGCNPYLRRKVIPLNQVEEARTALEAAEANLDLAIEHKRQAVLVAPRMGLSWLREIEEKSWCAHQTAFVLRHLQRVDYPDSGQ